MILRGLEFRRRPAALSWSTSNSVAAPQPGQQLKPRPLRYLVSRHQIRQS